MKTCKTCKWWGRAYTGFCDFVDSIPASTPEVLFQIDELAGDIVYGSHPGLRTGPDFGCIHHEPRTTGNEDERAAGAPVR